MTNKIESYARIIIGEGSNSYVYDIIRKGKEKWSIKATYTLNGEEFMKKHQIDTFKKVKLVDEIVTKASTLIKDILLKNETANK